MLQLCGLHEPRRNSYFCYYYIANSRLFDLFDLEQVKNNIYFLVQDICTIHTLTSSAHMYNTCTIHTLHDLGENICKHDIFFLILRLLCMIYALTSLLQIICSYSKSSSAYTYIISENMYVKMISTSKLGKENHLRTYITSVNNVSLIILKVYHLRGLTSQSYLMMYKQKK